MKSLCLFLLAAAPLAAEAASNIRPGREFSWNESSGWLDWRGDGLSGVEVGTFVCSGYIYSPNLGWINCGNGTPANGIRYQNDSAADFGVNVDAEGNLRGYAWGANIGWINFENMGAPSVDLLTGRLNGYAWGANIGWINLSDLTYYLEIDAINPGADSDRDGIADAWELTFGTSLDQFSALSDADLDGSSDREEYFGDTNPNLAADHLRVLRMSLGPDGFSTQLTWSSRPTRHYLVQVKDGAAPENLWTESGIGIVPGKGPVTSASVPAGTNAIRFFRIQVIRPLTQP